MIKRGRHALGETSGSVWQSDGDVLTGDSTFVERLPSAAARRDSKDSMCPKGGTCGT